MFFCVFSTLYAISGPIAVIFGDGLPSIFYSTTHTEMFLTLTVLAHAGILASTAFFKSMTLQIKDPRDPVSLYRTSIILAGMASSFEFVNFLRAGGLAVLSQGKAAYQSAIADMSMTLPSYNLAILAVALFVTSGQTTSLRRIVLFISILLPYLATIVSLGSRGAILAVILTAFIATGLRRPLSVLPIKICVLGLTLYISLGLLNSVRGVLPFALETGDYSLVFERLSDPGNVAKSLNPASAEFGAAFGNFSAYYDDPNTEPKYGRTYLEGFTIAIPRFIWPDKPTSILYQFRNEYYPAEADRGSIASTAYSSILEAYTNFRAPGVFFIYFILSLLVLSYERFLCKTKKLLPIIFYLTLTPIAISFHRSDMGNPLVIPILISTLVVLINYFVKNILKTGSLK